MTWMIVSMQKQLPYLSDSGHNYVALVDDRGSIVREFHGWFGKEFTFGTQEGNRLPPYPGNAG